MKRLIKDLGINEKYTKIRHVKESTFNHVKNNIRQEPNINLMADLLFLPTTEEGYKYLFIVVDLYSDAFDCEPLTSKTSSNLLQALKDIFKRGKYIKGAHVIQTDAGTEFKEKFSKYLYDNDIVHKTGKAGRHSQMSSVESLNRTIGRLLNGYMNSVEQKEGHIYREWTDILPEVIKKLNKYRKDKRVTSSLDEDIYATPDELPKFKIGDIVHEKLDRPESMLGHLQSTQNFREGDVRFSKVPKKIVNVIVMNDEPFYRYMLEGIDNASYTEKQLMKSTFKTQRYVVKDIINDRMNGNKKEYLVWWKGYKKSQATWEPRSNLIQDGLKAMIDDYEDN